MRKQMQMTQALVKKPTQSMTSGLTSVDLGLPNFDLAIQQHQQYVQALQDCGLAVTELPADEVYPDGCFIEDTAIITQHGAVITRPGAPSRRGETQAIYQALKKQMPVLGTISAPGTLDGGDVMQVGNHCYVGLSDRTNRPGADQLAAILASHDIKTTQVSVSGVLHLKTGVTFLCDQHLMVSGSFLDQPAFAAFDPIIIDPNEFYAANCIYLNGQVIIPAGFPKTADQLSQLGFALIEVEMSEFEKLDGGLTCLSLRY